LRIADWQHRRVTPRDLKDRTKAFAVAVINLTEGLPRTRAADVVGRQLIRAATSVAANYRSGCRARSRRDFISQMGIVEGEADESQFWLEVVGERRMADRASTHALWKEAGSIVAIVVAAIRTARGDRRANRQSAIRNPQCS
jgi:four helix bundle protein